MDSLKQLAEWCLGVPAGQPGQGTAWHLRVEPPWPAGVPPWAALLVGLSAVLVVVLVYRRDAASLSRGKRALLAGLRLGVIGVLLLLLTDITLTIDRTGLPVIVILVDDSASMSLEDRYADRDVDRQIQRLLADGGFQQATRLNIARSILTRRDGALLKKLIERHKIRVYRFSDTAHSVGRGEYLTAAEIDELLPLLSNLEAVGEQTRPGPAVRKVLDDLRGTPPSAVIVLSDGITSTTAADRLTTVIERASADLVPIFTVGIGSDEPNRDIQLYDTLAVEMAFVGDPVIFTSRLKTYGYEGKTLQVRLKDESTGEVLAVKQIKAGPDGESVKFQVTYTPQYQGEFDYTLEVPLGEGEQNAANNAETRHVSVREEQIRVLLVDSVPRYEFRYLKHLLERDKTVDVETVLQEADIEYAAEDETARERFPVQREELLNYDVIIFGDVNPSFLGTAVYENLDEFVREIGGGLVVIAGPLYTPLAYRGTPLEVLLPIKLNTAQAPPPEIPIVEGFRPRLTVEGRKEAPMFRFADSEQESLAIWRRLPELYWLFEAPDLAEGARVYAEHPTRRGSGRNLPVIVKHRVGAGTVLFHATDDLWRWRLRLGDLYYGRYWIQAIRHLSRAKLVGRKNFAELSTDRSTYSRGENVNLRVKFYDERLAPVEDDGVTVVVERRGDVQRPVKLSRLPEAPSVFEGQLLRPAQGSYHAFVIRPPFEQAPPSANFQVQAPDQELQRRSLDRAELLETAERTHGKFYTPAEADRLLQDIPPGHAVPLETLDPIPLWSRWQSVVPVIALFAGLLLAEWLLRKRFRLV